MRITQEVAGKIAIELTKKLKDRSVKLNNNFSNAVTAAYKKQVPKSVLNFFKLNKSWVKQTSTVTLTGNGFNYTYATLTEPLPSQNTHQVFLTMDADLACALLKLKNIADDAEDYYNKTRVEVKLSLISLNTHARIIANFPEAALLLPVGQTMALQINYDDVRAKIK